MNAAIPRTTGGTAGSGTAPLRSSPQIAPAAAKTRQLVGSDTDLAEDLSGVLAHLRWAVCACTFPGAP